MGFLIGLLERSSWFGFGIMIGAMAMQHFSDFTLVYSSGFLIWAAMFFSAFYLSEKERRKRANKTILEG
jgi:hypothetical protein|uniref:Uncharacterized protein n=1 Tax=Pleomorphic virus ThalV2 TaxID=3115753 RepID=A0AAT9JAS2_9VIRU